MKKLILCLAIILGSICYLSYTPKPEFEANILVEYTDYEPEFSVQAIFNQNESYSVANVNVRDADSVLAFSFFKVDDEPLPWVVEAINIEDSNGLYHSMKITLDIVDSELVIIKN